MPSRKSRQIREKGPDDASAMTRETVAHSSQIRMRVDRIAFFLMLMGMFIVCIALPFVSIGVLYIFTAPGGVKVTDRLLSTILVPGLIGLTIGIFILKVRADFRRFKSWTYKWVEFLSITNLGLVFKKDLQSEEMRRAFNQPEYEYPEYPEYGYKLEEKKKDKK